MQSLWNNTCSLPEFSSLNKNKSTEVLIIGGGITGILTAYFLHQKGVPYMLVEKERICSGTTGNTTAKITAQHGLIYDKLLKSEGKERAQMYLRANLNALEKFRKLAQSIDCDFETKDNYVYSLSDRKKLEDEITALSAIGYKADFCEKTDLPIKAVGAVRFKNQAQFHPLKFLSEIAMDLNIYENTHVNEMVGTTAVTDKGNITARKVVAATHFPFINKHGLYFMKLYQHRSYIIALENAPQINGMYVDEAEKGMSFRNHRNLLLLGGGDHRTGKTGGNWKELRDFSSRNYPEAKEKYYWAAQDCMSLDEIPYIGQYADSTPNFYTATGFNKWGMSGAMVAADILCDIITEGSSEYGKLFNPSRNMIKPQLFVNAAESMINLLTPTKKRCPHLGCALKWNSAEHSWDCPCHGSRFDEKGKLLDNPANDNLQKSK